MDRSLAKKQAQRISNILYKLHPLTRYHLCEFMSFIPDEPMCNTDIHDAIEEAEFDFSEQEIFKNQHLKTGIELRPINISVFPDKNGEVGYKIEED